MVTILSNGTTGRQNFAHKTYIYIHEIVVIEEDPKGSSFLQRNKMVLEFLNELEWHPLHLHPFNSKFCVHISYHCSVFKYFIEHMAI
jgi:stress-induced morphogen